MCSSLSAKEGTFLEAPFKPSHVYVWIMFMKKVAKIVQNKISPNFQRWPAVRARTVLQNSEGIFSRRVMAESSGSCLLASTKTAEGLNLGGWDGSQREDLLAEKKLVFFFVGQP